MKEMTIKIDEVTAKLIANTLEHYNLSKLEEAERLDAYKDNSYMIKAIKNFLKAYEEATK